MGRKKIEIKPLTDERNRNVTFLKRKAGLMKKAWELSVLCAADVSILIFSAAGKPYEFSSKDLDHEIDRYINYEGMMERRRAAEFAAMALADEDDEDDDDDDMPRRGSLSKGGAAGQIKPTKSLKGKEVFKQRGAGHSARSKHRHDRDRGRDDKRGFIDGILDKSSPSTHSGSSRSMNSRERDDRDLRDRRHDDMSMQYAMNMHQGNAGGGGLNYQSMSGGHVGSVPALSSNAWSFRQWDNTPASKFLQPSTNGYSASSGTNGGNGYYGSSSGGGGGGGYAPSQAASSGGSGGSGGGGGQWDQNILSRYAEFQLQQNHQRQQRALLERQRQQLAELGVPVEEKSLLDDIFGNGGNNGTSGSSVPYPDSQTPSTAGGAGGGGEFIWPSVNKRSHSVPHLPAGQDDELVWAQMQAQQDEMSFPSPPQGELGDRGDKRRIRSDAREDGHDKRARFDDQEARRASVW